MALHCKAVSDRTVCLLEQFVFVLFNDKIRTKGDFHVRFCEKFEVKVLLHTQLRGRDFSFREISPT